MARLIKGRPCRGRIGAAHCNRPYPPENRANRPNRQKAHIYQQLGLGRFVCAAKSKPSQTVPTGKKPIVINDLAWDGLHFSGAKMGVEEIQTVPGQIVDKPTEFGRWDGLQAFSGGIRPIAQRKGVMRCQN
jgi:hypothetical protein